MDVQCERCSTEYEFDDALVSGRGTTVRCTNCGHQFKVRKAEVSEPGADRWNVRTAAGQDLTFLTLRELQRAILAKQVGRGDSLRRGVGPPRTLGSIAELEPFFEGRTSSRPPPAGGSLQQPPMPSTPGVPQGADALPAFPKRAASWGATPEPSPALPPVRRKIDTLRPPGSAAAPPPMQYLAPPPSPPPVQVAPVINATPYAFGQGPGSPSIPEDPVTLRRPHATPAPPPMNLDTSSPLPPPTVPVQRGSRRSEDELPEMRPSLPSSSREDFYPLSQRRRVGGWVVALVLFLAVGVVGWVVAKPYLVARNAAATGPQLDPRALGLVTDGEKAMTEGNLDVAQESFDKASALFEHDPRVLVDEARVAAAKADVPWLKIRLLAPDARDEARTTKADLDDRVARARKSADAAVAVAAEDPSALRVRIDSLRLAGERDTARRDVSKIVAQASQPETAYVLAALDLSETEPLWTTVIDRLRLAAAGEGSAGRARAALVYALARSGDVTGAKAELAKLDALPRPYPLLLNLQAFVDRAPGKASLDGGVAANVPHIDLSSLPTQPPPPAGGAGAANDDTSVPGETSSAMKAAQQAIHHADWERARQIYGALVSRNPNDSEALAGLGDVSRAQGDVAGALSDYKRALAVNPSYLPALLGVADTEWSSGDHGSAVHSYKDIVDRFPDGTYPAYVKTRAEGGAPAAPTAGPSSGAATAAPPGSAAPPAAATTTAAPTGTNSL